MIRDYRKQILEDANHIDMVMLSGGVSSTDTLLRRLSIGDHPVVGVWVSLPNRDDNIAREDAIQSIRKYVAENYPQRDFIFANYMVRSEHKTEDFGPVEVCLHSTAMYDVISDATVYWSTCIESWDQYDQSKVLTMQDAIQGVYECELCGTREKLKDQMKRIPSDLLEKLV